jgi:hypothetical protein
VLPFAREGGGNPGGQGQGSVEADKEDDLDRLDTNGLRGLEGKQRKRNGG